MRKVFDSYEEYLESPEWQELRTKRLKIDGFKCQKCRCPFDLHVHHINYPKFEYLGTEDPYNDLITLCKVCHREIEEEKKNYKKEIDEKWAKFEQGIAELNKRYEKMKELSKRFIQDYAQYDISVAGKKNGKDYCNLSVLKADYFPFLRENGIQTNESVYGVQPISNYMRNRRYEIVLELMDAGLERKQIADQTGFSMNMIRKVFETPETIKSIIKFEKENEEYE